jgi:hypothetical protein
MTTLVVSGRFDDMDSTSPTAAAEELGTSAPRVLRAARRLGLAPEDGSSAPASSLT